MVFLEESDMYFCGELFYLIKFCWTIPLEEELVYWIG